jgi:hypothetical protein
VGAVRRQQRPGGRIGREDDADGEGPAGDVDARNPRIHAGRCSLGTAAIQVRWSDLDFGTWQALVIWPGGNLRRLSLGGERDPAIAAAAATRDRL